MFYTFWKLDWLGGYKVINLFLFIFIKILDCVSLDVDFIL